MRLLLALLVVSPLVYAGEEWVFLKDGSVGRGDPEREPISLTLPDNSTKTASKADILFRRTCEQVDRDVEAMIAEMARGKNIEAHTKRFQALRVAAVPKLLEFLAKPEAVNRLTALYAMQFAWAPQALEPVLKAMSDADRDVRKIAYVALARNVPEKDLAERLRSFADGDDLAVAAQVFEMVDKHFPDASLKRIQRLLRNPAYRSSAVARLSHYLSPALTEDTLPLLSAADPALKRAGVVGLIAQLSGADAVRLKVRPLLADANPDVREIAAEYFTWLGQPSDLPELKAPLDREKDPYACAALKAAMRSIQTRADAWAKDPERSKNLAKIQQADAFEPLLIYEVGEHDRKQAFADRALRLQEALAAPGCVQRENPRFFGEAQPRVAETWMPPVREYFDAARKSFGFTMTKDYTAFVGSVHIGDDVGWNRENRTVVAVAPGVVRSVQHIFSWGFIVVVEHHLSGGERCCSLYAHLSPMLHVQPGDLIEAGQKVGSIGRSHTVENGGYAAHVHVGLHRGAFERGEWVCGYISTQAWADGGIGWMDPQVFLKERTAPAANRTAAPQAVGR